MLGLNVKNKPNKWVQNEILFISSPYNHVFYILDVIKLILHVFIVQE